MSDSSKKRGLSPLPIETVHRVLAYALGVALVATGAVATFVPDGQEWGAVALIAVGGIVLLTAVIGRFPSSIKAGGVDLSFEEQQDIAAALGELQPAVRDYLADWFVKVTGDEGIAATSRQEPAENFTRAGRELDEYVISALRAIPGATVHTDVAVPGPRGRPLLIDAVFTKGGRSWAVEIKDKMSRPGYLRGTDRLERALEYGRFDGALLALGDMAQTENVVPPPGVHIVASTDIASFAEAL